MQGPCFRQRRFKQWTLTRKSGDRHCPGKKEKTNCWRMRETWYSVPQQPHYRCIYVLTENVVYSAVAASCPPTQNSSPLELQDSQCLPVMHFCAGVFAIRLFVCAGMGFSLSVSYINSDFFHPMWQWQNWAIKDAYKVISRKRLFKRDLRWV